MAENAESDPGKAPPDPGKGETFGRYRLQELLGHGGMGQVWKAWDPQLQRCVALKLIRSEELVDEAAVARFRREARLAANLRHPNIVPIHDVGQVGGQPFLAMELIEGPTFHALLAETAAQKRAGTEGSLHGLRRDVEVLAQVAEAAAHAHAEGVLHRDLKPSNVALDGTGRAFVLDFGMAKELSPDAPPGGKHDAGPTDRAFTLTDRSLGTPAYMSPEQALGNWQEVGPPSDQWALGIMLYEALTGATPFERGSPVMTLAAVLNDLPQPPRKTNSRVPMELEWVCLQALEKAPARRHAGVRALAADLRRWLRGEPVSARPASREARLDRALGSFWYKLTGTPWTGLAKEFLASAVVLVTVAALLLGLFMVGKLSGPRRDDDPNDPWLRGARALADAEEARRAGDLDRMRSKRAAFESALGASRSRMRSLDSHRRYAIGRFERAMMNDKAAALWQESLLDEEPNDEGALYERLLLRGRAYHRLLAELRHRPRAPGAPGPSVDDLEREDEGLRRARDHLFYGLRSFASVFPRQNPGYRKRRREQLRDLDNMGVATGLVLAGMLATYDGAGWAVARWGFEKAKAQRTHEEVHEGLFQAAYRFEQWEEAIAACTRGMEVDRGYLPHRVNRATAVAELAARAHERGEDPADLQARALADLDAALGLAPAYAPALVRRALLRWTWGRQRAARGVDAVEWYRQALADLDHALKIDADLPDARRLREAVAAHLGLAPPVVPPAPAPGEAQGPGTGT
ncbi:MAG: serine/threonine protein kinase [Planctomycetes bacterium]|nr:serine/threonine protein kinase [Planctomycetota bacterium]